MTHAERDYRASYLDPDKGISYDGRFRAWSYTRYVWTWEQQVLSDILGAHFAGNNGIRYLDFACGTGRIAAFLENHVAEAVGVDVSDSMLRVGRQNVQKANLIKADLTRKNIFIGKRFDLITAFRFFLHAQQALRNEALKTLAKILSPDGCLVFNIHMNRGAIVQRILAVNAAVRGLPSDVVRAIGIREVREMVGTAGLEIVRMYHLGVVPISREDARVPHWFLNVIEKPASRIPFLAPFSRYVIYVCRHRGRHDA